jgi:hypothetical protein
MHDALTPLGASHGQVEAVASPSTSAEVATMTS